MLIPSHILLYLIIRNFTSHNTCPVTQRHTTKQRTDVKSAYLFPLVNVSPNKSGVK